MTSVPLILVTILMTLKLSGYIFIGWIWVFAPMWIPLIALSMFLLVALSVAGAIAFFND